MSQVQVWFERKFEFSFPAELFPNLRTRLRGTPARLEETLRGRAPKSSSGKASRSGRHRNMPATCSISNRYGWRGWVIT